MSSSDPIPLHPERMGAPVEGTGTDRPDPAGLMERIHRGDRRAMDELVAAYWHRLVGFAAGLTGSSEAAEDLVQGVFLKLWEGRRAWTPTDRLQALLYRMTRNAALNRVRDQQNRTRLLEGFRSWRRRPGTPEEILEAADLARTVETAVASLPPRQREVFILARYHGQSYREIAEVLEVSPQTVANQMSSALRALRERLAHLR